MTGTMESIKEHLRSCHGVVRAPLAFIIRKTIIVQINGDYPNYVTPDDEKIARMGKVHSQSLSIQKSM